MDTERKPRARSFNWKRLTSFLVTFSFLLMAASGAGLYSAPRGRVANWTGWTALGLDKDAWSSVHINTSIIFIVAGAFHIYFNWGLLLGYFKAALSKGLGGKRELAAAALVSLVVATGAMLSWPPFSTIMAWNEDIKAYWEEHYAPAPFPHAELATIDELTAHPAVPVSAGEAIERLRAKGYEVAGSTVTIEELAEAQGKNPSQVFADLGLRAQPAGRRRGASRTGAGGASAQDAAGSEGYGGGRGGSYGRMTVDSAAREAGVPIEQALERLRAAGLEASGSSRLRDLAESSGMRPSAVYGVILGDAPARR